MESDDGGEVALVGRAEIDTRAPFRSVREAIVLFGERVLAGEVYASKLHEMRAAASSSREDGACALGTVVAELEETKQRLDRAREENMVMAHSLSSLQEELHNTREELLQLKARESEKRVVESEMEDLKFVENATEVVDQAEMATASSDGRPEIQRRRYVKFANPPSVVAQVMTPAETPQVLLERQFSVDRATVPTKKSKKKALIPLLGGIFSRKKG